MKAGKQKVGKRVGESVSQKASKSDLRHVGALRLISLERTRQKEIAGYSESHDDAHDKRELARAAECFVHLYVARGWVYTNELGMPGITDGPKQYRSEPMPDDWPWVDKWNPETPLIDLVKAGALIAAEIDRLLRAGSPETVKAVKSFPLTLPPGSLTPKEVA